MPAISIIICTRNRAVSLDETLVSLEALDIPADLSCEILVVDNGSTDHTAEVVRKYSTARIPPRYLLESTPGLSRARNAGMAFAHGEIIVFTDDDLRFPKCWLENMCEPIIAKKADAVAGNVELAPHLRRPWMTTQHCGWLAATGQRDPLKVYNMVGASMAFARSILKVVPTFDVELGPSALGSEEETLFSFQLKKAGGKILCSNGPAALHYFDEKRLSRIYWLRAAKGRGASEAYVLHHWKHEKVPFPRLRYYYFGLKLGLRRLLEPPPPLDGEGTAPWEMSYVSEMEKCRHFLVECRRPRNYSKHGLRKIGA